MKRRGRHSLPGMLLNPIGDSPISPPNSTLITCLAIGLAICLTGQAPRLRAAEETSSTDAAHAADWSRFRGPNGSGAVDGVAIPSQWSPADLLWSVDLPGLGHSSPVVWGSHIFLQSADRDHARQYLLCLSRDDGRTVWQKQFPGVDYRIHTRNSFATATPGVDDEHVYFAWSTADETTLLAFTHDGELVWKQHLGPYVSSHGFASSPIPVGDLVVIASLQSDEPNRELGPDGPIGSSYIAAYDRDSGEQRWKIVRHSGKASYSVPALYHGSDGQPQLVCCDTRDGMFGLALADGKPLWNLPVFDKRTVSSPLIIGSTIFGSTGSGGGGNYVVAVDVSAEPRELYRVTNSAPYVPTPVAKDDLVFLWSDGGIVTCAEISTGKQVWRKRVEGDYSSSPVRIGDQIVGVAEDGLVTVLAAAREFQELGQTSLGEPSRATPAVTPTAVYFRTESKLMCLPTLE